MTPTSPVLVPAGKGKTLHAFGDKVTLLLEGAQTGGRFTMFHSETPPGGGPPLHTHAKEDEWFHVLEGSAAFWVNGQWQNAGPGAAAFVPRGAVHTFKNTGKTPLRQIITLSPAGFEVFFERCSNIFAQPGKPDLARIEAIAADHGIQFVR